MILFAKLEQRHRHREQTYGYQWGSGGGMNCEIGIDVYTLTCKKWITNKNLLYKKINKIKFKKRIKEKEQK